ncbi:MAG: phage tail protein [Chloroflexota bacterium]|nr:phage tail protein [Anaerolineales bacterium]MCA9974714.1 phage tail protein [Anaerolineales bacterium]
MSMEQLRALTNPTFRFLVSVEGIPQGVFTECTLPSIEWEIEELKEGGLNTYVHQLPGMRRSAKLILKNGVGTSALMNWYIETMKEKFTRRKVTIMLLNAKDKLNQPIMTWNIEGAYPTKWTGPQLNSGENSIAIQTLELACAQVSMA